MRTAEYRTPVNRYVVNAVVLDSGGGGGGGSVTVVCHGCWRRRRHLDGVFDAA